MASREEFANGVHPPIDTANAERIRAETAESVGVARIQFIEELLARRFAAAEAKEAHAAEQCLRAAKLLEEAYADARRIRREAAADAAEITKAGHEEVQRRLQEAQTLADATKALALPPPARPGGPELLTDLGKLVVERGFSLLQTVLQANPALAAKVGNAANSVINQIAQDEPAAATDQPPASAATSAAPEGPSVEPAPSPAPLHSFTVADFAHASQKLPRERLKALCDSFGVNSPDEATPEFMAAVIHAYEEQRAGGPS